MNIPYTESNGLRALSAHLGEFLKEGVEQLGSTVVEASNQGVRLRRVVRGLPFVEIDGLHYSPELGLALKEDEILGVYGMREGRRHVIEFDFSGGPALLRLTEQFPTEPPSTYAPIFEEHLAKPLSADSLATLRAAMIPEPKLCEHCREGAERRVERIQSLPIYKIAQDILEIDEDFTFTKPGPYTEVSATLNFQSLRVHGGVLALHDEHDGSQLDIDVRFVHMLHVNQNQRSDETINVLDIYNQRGYPILRINSESPHMAARWIEICERAIS